MSWRARSDALEADEFEQEVAAHSLVVVHFWADWNVFDQFMDRSIQRMRGDFPSIAFFAFDTGPEENWDIARQYAAYTLPMLLCFVNGQHHGTASGDLSESDLHAKLREWVAAST